jgi:hypothetical protein
MKLSIIAVFSTLAAASAFAPSASQSSSTTALNAEASRKAFLGAAAAAVFGVALPAFAMDQELVTDKTEQWETGVPNAAAESARMARYTNARTQLNSNFAPQKRLTLERKSPVVSGSVLWLCDFVCPCCRYVMRIVKVTLLTVGVLVSLPLLAIVTDPPRH